MPTPQEAYNTAYQSASSGMEKKVKDNLRQNWRKLQLAAAKKGKSFDRDPSEAELDAMAAEMIDQRQITFDGKTLTFAELDADAEIRQALGGKTMSSLVPTRGQVNAIATEVGQGVGENTGSFGGAGFMDLIKGFMSWLMSGFSGGFAGLMQAIGNVTGSNMGNSVSRRLTRLAAANPDMASFLGPEQIQEAAGQVRQTAVNMANGQAPSAADAATTPGIQELDGNARAMVATKVYEEMKPEMLKGLKADKTLGGLWENPDAPATGDLAAAGITDKAKLRGALEGMADAAAKRISEVVKDANFTYRGNEAHLSKLVGKKLSDMTDDDRAAVLAAEGKRAAADSLKGAGLDPKSAEASLANVALGEMGPKLREGIKENLKRIPMGALGHGHAKAGTANLAGVETPDLSAREKVYSRAIAGKFNKFLHDNPEKAELIRKMAGGDLPIDKIAEAVSRPAAEFDKNQEGKPVTPEQFEALSASFREAIEKDGNTTLSKAGIAALADEMALNFLNELNKKAGGANIPNSVLDKNREAAIAEQIAKSIKEMPEAQLRNIERAAGAALDEGRSKAIADAIAPAINTFEKTLDRDKKASADDFPELAEKMRAALIANKSKINAGKFNLSNEALTAAADQMAIEYLKTKGVSEAAIKANTAYKKQIDENNEAAVKHTAQKLVFSGLEEFITNPKEAAEMKDACGGILPSSHQLQMIAAAAKSQIADFELKHGTAKVTDADYVKLSAAILKDLKAQRTAINDGAAQLNDDVLAVVADEMTEKFLEDKLGGKDSHDEFAKQKRDHRVKAAGSVVSREVGQGLQQNLNPSSGFWGTVGGTALTLLNGGYLVDQNYINRSITPVIAKLVTDDTFKNASKEEQKKLLVQRLDPILKGLKDIKGKNYLTDRAADKLVNDISDTVVETMQKRKQEAQKAAGSPATPVAFESDFKATTVPVPGKPQRTTPGLSC